MESKLFCKFCEKKSADVVMSDDQSLVQVICDCGCHSPIRSTKVGAVRAWTALHGKQRKREK